MRRGTGSRSRARVLGLALFAVLLCVGTSHAQGLFVPPVHYAVGFSPRDVATGDLNHDGRLDLVVATEGSHSISVLLNNGDGTFQPASSFDVGFCPLAVTIGKMDDDRYPDVITSNSCSNNISVLINNGDGSFAPAVNYSVGGSPWGIVAEDLNGDGSTDVAVVNRDSRNFSVLLNSGDGTLSLSGNYHAGGAYIHPSWLTAADFDGDEDVDIAVTKNYHNLYFNAGYVEVFVNDGSGGFSSDRVITTGWSATTPMAEDFDGDEDMDLAISGFTENSYKLSMLLNDGSGTFAEPVAYYAGADGRAHCADLDRDGDCDVVISSQGVGAYSFSVLLNNGDATFASAFTVAVGPDPMGLSAGDFDLDGDNDVAVAVLGDNTVAVTMNTTDPTTGVEDWGSLDRTSGYRLDQNHPNPFNPKTVIRYALPQPTEVRLVVYDVHGRQVRVLADGMQDAGDKESFWNGRDELGREVQSGVYFYRLEAAGFSERRKMILLR